MYDEAQNQRMLMALTQRKSNEVQLALVKGADPNCSTASGRTALAVAARWGDEKSIAILLEKGADLERMDNLGMTPLACAISANQTSCAERLIKAGANVNSMDDRGISILMLAADRMPNIVNTLLERGADVTRKDMNGLTVLNHAARNKEIMPLLMRYHEEKILEKEVDQCGKDRKKKKI